MSLIADAPVIGLAVPHHIVWDVLRVATALWAALNVMVLVRGFRPGRPRAAYLSLVIWQSFAVVFNIQRLGKPLLVIVSGLVLAGVVSCWCATRELRKADGRNGRKNGHR